VHKLHGRLRRGEERKEWEEEEDAV